MKGFGSMLLFVALVASVLAVISCEPDDNERCQRAAEGSTSYTYVSLAKGRARSCAQLSGCNSGFQDPGYTARCCCVSGSASNGHSNGHSNGGDRGRGRGRGRGGRSNEAPNLDHQNNQEIWV